MQAIPSGFREQARSYNGMLSLRPWMDFQVKAPDCWYYPVFRCSTYPQMTQITQMEEVAFKRERNRPIGNMTRMYFCISLVICVRL